MPGRSQSDERFIASRACCLCVGVMYPKEGPTNKQTGRRVEKFGPLKGFSLDLSGKTAQVGQGGQGWERSRALCLRSLSRVPAFQGSFGLQV
jgi:hypothetical protein